MRVKCCTVIPGRCEASNPESRDSPMRNCASEVWSFGPSRNDDVLAGRPSLPSLLNLAVAFVLKAEIARRDALVRGDLIGRSAEHEFAQLHHVRAVGDLQRGLRV